ncbi:Retinol dehydrogenase 11 [Zootermopsis nevadensis]|uniref:Retinol dehydrogenase 11 n=1 Tax=Zootermopsis nevadensis TaxID=136037 RepID=A0A067R7Z1_ZOONE|nr:Retinol dehydrogenase 11 [Zootermopsis nevadensis]
MWPFYGWCRSKARLDGKTAIITGCNTGIGKFTALDFVRRGARVIMACRDTKKASEAAQEIRMMTDGLEGAGDVVVVRLDLSSLTSVREFAANILCNEPRIHLLINNAGVMCCPKGLTEDGYEMHLGVNHLGHFLLTCLLLPRILSSKPARIVNVASHAHYIGTIDFEDLNWEKSYSPTFAYSRSKLANVLFTKELATRTQGTGVTTYSVHPGVVATGLGRHLDTAFFKGITWLFDNIGKLFIKTPEQGAQTTIYCAVDERTKNETGLYYSDCRRFPTLAKARDKEVARKLWDVSKCLVGLEDWDPLTAPDTNGQPTVGN